MSDITERLRDRTTLRYMGNCKCGKCQLVPKQLVGDAANELDRLRILNTALLKAADDLLNDCINFDGGKLTDTIIRRASWVITAAKGATHTEERKRLDG